jgi:hypothetical protein
VALKQPNSAAVWSEPAGSGAAAVITPIYLIDDGLGAHTDSPTGDIAARLLADGLGGFTEQDGDGNPGGLAELRLVDFGDYITDYE